MDVEDGVDCVEVNHFELYLKRLHLDAHWLDIGLAPQLRITFECASRSRGRD